MLTKSENYLKSETELENTVKAHSEKTLLIDGLKEKLTSIKNQEPQIAEKQKYVTEIEAQYEEYNLLKEKKTSIDETLAIANGKYQVAVEAFEKLKAERSDEIPLQTLLEEKEKIEKEHNSLQEKIGATRTQVESYEKNKSTLETLEKYLDVKQA